MAVFVKRPYLLDTYELFTGEILYLHLLYSNALITASESSTDAKASGSQLEERILSQIYHSINHLLITKGKSTFTWNNLMGKT